MRENLPCRRFWKVVFVPFLGDFFSIACIRRRSRYGRSVFVPFLGDFLSMTLHGLSKHLKLVKCFRPLSWGLSFNQKLGFNI